MEDLEDVSKSRRMHGKYSSSPNVSKGAVKTMKHITYRQD